MKQLTNNSSKTRAWALTSASVLVLGVAGLPLAPSMAFAQDDDVDEIEEVEETDDTIVVTGIRSSLRSAQQIKRNADTIVDSITATDIGAFPDKSVAEALQRVAGITVSRFAASDDTAHFSAEPSGVIVRGLQQVRSEFNGRDTFSANSSRGLSFSDVSPELIGGVDTYKNQMAELIEGGIAGTVNLRTRVPFDSNGQLIAVSGNLNYGDIAKKINPEISGIYSNRWDTEIGEFGFLGNLAYSELTTKTEGIQLYRMNRFQDIYFDGLAYVPAAANFRENTYNRTREGLALAGQWRSPDDKFLVTTQFNRSEYENAWEEYVVQTLPADLSYNQSVFYNVPASDADGNRVPPTNAPGTDPFTFDDNGLFQSGTLVSPIGWWGNNDDESAYFARNDQGQQLVNACYGWNGCEPNLRGSDMNTVTRSNNNNNVTQDTSINLKWTPTDRWRFNFDAQYVESEVQNYDIEIGMNSYANVFLDISGEYPELEFLDPTNVNLTTLAGYEDNPWVNPGNFYYRHIMDHIEDSEGTELALRGDAEYVVDSGWISSIKVGARYADRDQTVRWSGYNWQNVANNWTCDAPYFNVNSYDSATLPEAGATACGLTPAFTFNGYPQGAVEGRAFGEDHFGSVFPNEFLFFNMDLAQNQEAMAAAFSAQTLGFPDGSGLGWDPICSNRGDRSNEVAGTCFTPAEIADVREETNAFYAQVNYGGPDAMLFGIPVSGNIGVRYVETKNSSTGGISIPQFDEGLFYEVTADTDGDGDIDAGDERTPLPVAPGNQGCYDREASENPDDPNFGVPPNPPVTLGCFISDEDVMFANNADLITTAEQTHEHWLPSFNIKFDLSDEWVLRFAASRALSRPDIGNLRNYLGVGVQTPSLDNTGDPLWVTDGSGTIVGANVEYSGGAQNPFLAPVTANQFDISLERYFADVGSFSFAVFYKEFEDYIQFGTYYRDVTNNGVTREVEVRGPLNGDGAAIKGFEVAYQRFFDFLPAPYDGFGIQANYTYVNNQGIRNPGISAVGSQAGELPEEGAEGQAPDSIEVDRLEGMSDHAYNVVGIYEKGPFAARLAYNWRSEYLTTAIDCCVAYAIWTEDQGFLDGSVRYRINDNFEVSFQGQNLLNTDTITKQQVTNASDGGLLLPSGYFQNDRRFTFGLRFKY